MKFKICTAILALGMAQCTSLNQIQCQHSNWHSFGMTDGNSGKSSSTLNTYIEDCSEFGLAVNSEEWTTGYLVGLENYCLPENGYKQGLEGSNYNGVCSNNKFVKRYNEGYKQFEIKSKIVAIQSRLKNIEYELTKVDNEDKRSLKNERDDLETELMLLRIQTANIFSIQFHL
ncbi:DUF2799 domain-containing protein [Shewanella gelidimarina]|uniref:DUF2799 domain-containing protein n=1 Tax=Shewanella gelidimarina TaxID=56813 RepID=UPI0020103D80|nr:DUF2799 domain-containing protein [Shewanella gelidimarina]MCL1060117.1 DUF2799 domain-containing protein [Shewanella gelidimarina]